MALMSSRVARATQDNFTVPRRLNEHQLDSKLSGERKVPVVYYLCRNGQLDHPHFIEVSLSSHHGLFLTDVINRLNDLRGKGMACLYSWSSKRIYKKGFVWQDLSEDDFIFPVHGQEYVLKGSQILDFGISGRESDFPIVVTRRRNQSWGEYKVYKSSESTRKLATDASTQTDDLRRRKKPAITLETLMKADGQLILRPDEDRELNRTVESLSSGKMTASMQLISCGAMSFKECGSTGCTIERGTGDYRLVRAEKELRSFGRDILKKELVPALKKSSSYNTDSENKT